jgi:hypothetical protein
LVEGLENRGHIVAMDKKFASIELPLNMESRGIHGMETIGSNKIGLPKVITNTKQFGKNTPTCSTIFKFWFKTPLEYTLIVHVMNH